MPPELLKAISDMLKSLRTPAGVAGSGPIGRDERGRFVNKGQEVLAFAIEKLNKTLCGRGSDEATKLLGRRQDRIILDTLSSSISKIIERSNKLYEVDKYMKEKGFTNKEAALRVMQLRDPDRLKKVEYSSRYGSDADRVIEAEAGAESVESSLANIKNGIKVIGTFASGFAIGYRAMTGLMKFVADASVGMTKFTSQLYEINRVFSISEKVMSAFTATGMDAVSASRAAGAIETWGAGLQYGVGIDKLKKLAIAGFDVSGINPMTATQEDIMRVIAPQAQKKTARERASAIAIGAVSAEEMRGYMTYGKTFDELDYEEQVNAQRAAWQEKLNRMRMEIARLPMGERLAKRTMLESLEAQGPDAWMWNEGVFGDTYDEMRMEQKNRRDMANIPDARRSWLNRRGAVERRFIETKSYTDYNYAPGVGYVPINRKPSDNQINDYMKAWDERNPAPGADTSLFPNGAKPEQITNNNTVDMSNMVVNITSGNEREMADRFVSVLNTVGNGIIVSIPNTEKV